MQINAKYRIIEKNRSPGKYQFREKIDLKSGAYETERAHEVWGLMFTDLYLRADNDWIITTNYTFIFMPLLTEIALQIQVLKPLRHTDMKMPAAKQETKKRLSTEPCHVI